MPGYHIEDQKPGVKKCGHQGGKVLVSENEQIQRLSAARFQLDIMGVAGIIVARTDAEAANLLDGCADERDQPFILGATNLDIPSYKAVVLAIHRKFFEAGVEEVRGHLMFAMSDGEYAAANAWLDRRGLLPLLREDAEAFKKNADGAGRSDARQGRRRASWTPGRKRPTSRPIARRWPRRSPSASARARAST